MHRKCTQVNFRNKKNEAGLFESSAGRSNPVIGSTKPTGYLYVAILLTGNKCFLKYLQAAEGVPRSVYFQAQTIAMNKSRYNAAGGCSNAAVLIDSTIPSHLHKLFHFQSHLRALTLAGSPAADELFNLSKLRTHCTTLA